MFRIGGAGGFSGFGGWAGGGFRVGWVFVAMVLVVLVVGGGGGFPARFAVGGSGGGRGGLVGWALGVVTSGHVLVRERIVMQERRGLKRRKKKKMEEEEELERRWSPKSGMGYLGFGGLFYN